MKVAGRCTVAWQTIDLKSMLCLRSRDGSEQTGLPPVRHIARRRAAQCFGSAVLDRRRALDVRVAPHRQRDHASPDSARPMSSRAEPTPRTLGPGRMRSSVAALLPGEPGARFVAFAIVAGAPATASSNRAFSWPPVGWLPRDGQPTGGRSSASTDENFARTPATAAQSGFRHRAARFLNLPPSQ
jgi:hypothetical protein